MTAGPPPAPDRLVVRTDRRLVGRLVRRANVVPLLVALTVCAVLGGSIGAVLTTLEGGGEALLAGALGGVVIALGAFMTGFVVYLLEAVVHMVHREVDVMAVIEPAGMHLAAPGTDVGSFYLPWDAVESIVPRRRGVRAQLTVRAAPGLRRDHPGARGLEDDVLWDALRKRGYNVRTGTALVPHEQVVAAVRHFAPPGLVR